MMKFLIQRIDGNIVHDFNLELLMAIKYGNWREPESMSYIMCEYSELEKMSLQYPDIYEYVPSGSIEFVEAFLKLYINEDAELLPINVPNLGINITSHVKTITFTGNVDKDYKALSNAFDFGLSILYLKSTSKLKAVENGLYDLNRGREVLKNLRGTYQVREQIRNLVNEFRIFVFKDEVESIVKYRTNNIYERYLPSERLVTGLISEIRRTGLVDGETPNAYSFDLWTDNNDSVYFGEAHEFYSTGLYGFSDYRKTPYMFYQSWQFIKNRNKK